MKVSQSHCADAATSAHAKEIVLLRSLLTHTADLDAGAATEILRVLGVDLLPRSRAR